ncbi:methyltransferase domain-containing protein [Acetobacteraceae bacterium KSS8]|uniref:Methyltransferase domain-containing protein n=1 Tax=Endosaccharibacter trunci TaxID=2812733 RepID=A0ABT1W518_9PROT|nr:methyltransferase domain-containing protein [Acetobacteraceae bacterium KSS8]
MDDSQIFDRRSVRLHRDRAASRVDAVADILSAGADLLLDRLDDVKRSFTRALDIGGRGVVSPALRTRGIETVACDLSPAMAHRSGGDLVLAADEEWLPFAEGSFDLVVASLSLHWVNDLPGALIQLRRALRPDGLLLASLPILPTLSALRAGLLTAESALSGGASPRVSPFPELRDCAALLQRAGFALPVADSDSLRLSYADPMALLRDLRAAGETNAIRLRDRRPMAAEMIPMALASLETDEKGRVPVALEIAIMTGWAPSPDQPKPLKPGQATIRLEDALAAMPDAEKPC